MKRVLAIFMLLVGALLSGCQVTHSLPQPNMNFNQPLPEIHVSVIGDIPSYEIRNDLRRRGTFEKIIEGGSADGYNLLVISKSNRMGLHNIPKMLLSAFTMFLVPAPVSWDSEVGFVLSQGSQPLSTYYISNHTEHYLGLVVGSQGRDEHVQRIVDRFIAQVLTEQPLKVELPMKGEDAFVIQGKKLDDEKQEGN